MSILGLVEDLGTVTNTIDSAAFCGIVKESAKGGKEIAAVVVPDASTAAYVPQEKGGSWWGTFLKCLAVGGGLWLAFKAGKAVGAVQGAAAAVAASGALNEFVNGLGEGVSEAFNELGKAAKKEEGKFDSTPLQLEVEDLPARGPAAPEGPDL